MEEDKKTGLTEEDKKMLEKMRPEKRSGFKFFPSAGDEDERPWILRNLWWILIIVGALIINFLFTK
jgi:hypothetical protein